MCLPHAFHVQCFRMPTRGVTRSRATTSREIKLDDITHRVKNLSREIVSHPNFYLWHVGAVMRLCILPEPQGVGKEEEEEEKEGKQP